MKIKPGATKKTNFPAKKKQAVAKPILKKNAKDTKIKKLTGEISILRAEMQTLFEFGVAVNKQKELLNKVLGFHKADKKTLEKAVKSRTKQFEAKNTELKIANKKLAFQNKEKEKRAAELGIANKELMYQNKEKEKRAAELGVANKELAFQNKEKEKKAVELVIANKELAFQNKEKEKRSAELGIANKELAFQNNEKEKRASELSIANTELAFQNVEKEKREAELITANQDLTSFTYISSHDLQEPLRKIQNFASILLAEEKENLSQNGKSYFERMMQTARRMQQLIEDLLTYSRTKTADRVFETTNLNSFTDEIKKHLEEIILQKKAIIKTDLGNAKIIRFQFRQLLHNLISNSLKFSQGGVIPKIKITSKIIAGNKLNNKYLLPQKKYCHITIEDNGIGFEPQYKERIFEVFQRLHSAQEYSGTGIGLAICKRIVDNHNGIITANGELNKGAKFDIYIPAEHI